MLMTPNNALLTDTYTLTASRSTPRASILRLRRSSVAVAALGLPNTGDAGREHK
jgi:hypothetical protein